MAPCKKHPKAEAVISSLTTYPELAASLGFTREQAAFRNAEALLQIPTRLVAAMFLMETHCVGVHGVTSAGCVRQVKQTGTGFALTKHGRSHGFRSDLQVFLRVYRAPFGRPTYNVVTLPASACL